MPGDLPTPCRPVHLLAGSHAVKVSLQRIFVSCFLSSSLPFPNISVLIPLVIWIILHTFQPVSTTPQLTKCRLPLLQTDYDVISRRRHHDDAALDDGASWREDRSTQLPRTTAAGQRCVRPGDGQVWGRESGQAVPSVRGEGERQLLRSTRLPSLQGTPSGFLTSSGAI